jgi:serine/threonine protein phosphatase PrpC
VADYAGSSDVGRVRHDNQDRYLTMRRGGVTLLAVADGVGGEAGGGVASAAAIDGLAGAFDFGSSDVASALASAMRAANDAVLRAASERGHATAASTLVAVSVRGRHCAVANLGDSRAYLVRHGEAVQITADHSGSIARSITRFVGDPRGVAPDVFAEDLRPRDRLVLCSDGLTRHVPAEEIASAATNAAPARAASALVDLANDRGGEDNVTVIVYESPARRVRSVLLLALCLVVALAAAAAVATGVPPTAAPTPLPSASPTAAASPTPGPSASP